MPIEAPDGSWFGSPPPGLPWKGTHQWGSLPTFASLSAFPPRKPNAVALNQASHDQEERRQEALGKTKASYGFVRNKTEYKWYS